MIALKHMRLANGGGSAATNPTELFACYIFIDWGGCDTVDQCGFDFGDCPGKDVCLVDY